jgi:hypothetical protein
MKINKLIPLNEVSADKVKELFNKNSNFAWNVRHYAESSESDFIQEMFKAFGDDLKLEYEYGIFTKCRFSVNHDPTSMCRFAEACIDIGRDYCFFTKEDYPPIEALTMRVMAFRECAPELEDEILEKGYVLMDEVCAIVAKHLLEIFRHLESDNNIIEGYLESFIECYGDTLFLDPTNDSILELKNMNMWDF